MTPTQEKEFLQGLGGQGNADTDSTPHSPTSGKGLGKGAPVEAPDTGKNPGSGYESSTAEDFGHVVEVETGDKAQAQTGNYDGQESKRPVENSNSNTPTEYTPPAGGGGVTEEIQVGDNTVTFGHGGRHLKDSGLSMDDVNLAIAMDVCKNPPKAGEYFKRRIEVDGFTIEYRVYGTSDSTFKVGTYMIKE